MIEKRSKKKNSKIDLFWPRSGPRPENASVFFPRAKRAPPTFQAVGASPYVYIYIFLKGVLVTYEVRWGVWGVGRQTYNSTPTPTPTPTHP